MLHPLAQISLEVEGHPITVEAASSTTLPMSVLLGTDNPELYELLGERNNKAVEKALAVTTRAVSRRQEDKRREESQEYEGVWRTAKFTA